MIITRTPLRISIGGGGTDLPSYYERFGGFVISAAVNKHIYVGINETFSGGYFLKYSSLEHAFQIDVFGAQSRARTPGARAYPDGLRQASYL